ncbi:MAG TPA: S41 family peptidase [Anaerolineaceae bacterium]|nr:S41 family peptidase [Anaerolineaceae bacterium]HPN53989.1 S41 family peptidase [Anaerolineaceae bacterium]
MNRLSPRLQTLLFFFIMMFTLVLAGLAGYLLRGMVDRSQAQYPIFDEVVRLLDRYSLNPVPEKTQLEYGMIRGMVATFNDPYTNFVDPPHHEVQTQVLEGKFGGIGVRMEWDEKGQLRLYPMPDSPAVQAGVLEGDILVRVGELKIEPKMDFTLIQAAVRGPVGEPVTITLQRALDGRVEDVAIVRAEISLPSTTWNVLPDEPTLGIIHIASIAATTPDEVQAAVKDLRERGVSGFILDVRNNGGGLVDAGVNLARLFLSEGVVIEQQSKGQPVKQFLVEKEGALAKDTPLVILVNGNSASATEIFAGALQAQGRARLVGQPTFGKDLVQSVFTLSDGSSLHVTTAHWWVPGHTVPLQPDVTVDAAAEEAAWLRAAAEALKP